MKTDVVSIVSEALPSVAFGAVGFVVLLIVTVLLRRAVRRWRFGDKRNDVARHWKAVEDLVNRGDEISLRMAIIQADAVLDLALKTRNFSGETTGERLNSASKMYRQLEPTFRARSLRNTLVHEAGSKVKNSTAFWAIGEFKKALVVLGAL